MVRHSRRLCFTLCYTADLITSLKIRSQDLIRVQGNGVTRFRGDASGDLRVDSKSKHHDQDHLQGSSIAEYALDCASLRPPEGFTSGEVPFAEYHHRLGDPSSSGRIHIRRGSVVKYHHRLGEQLHCQGVPSHSAR